MYIKEISIQEFNLNKKIIEDNIFNSENWLKIYNDDLIINGIFESEKKMIGYFYYYISKKIGVKILRNPPFLQNCNLYYINNSSNNSSINNKNKEVFELITKYIAQQKSKITILSFPSHYYDFQHFKWNDYKVIPDYTYRINLTDSIEKIKSNFDSKNRNAISKITNTEIIIKYNSLSYNELYLLYNKYLKSLNASTFDEIMEKIFQKFANTHNSFSIESYIDNILVSSVFCIYDKKICYFLFSAINKEYIKLNSVNILLSKSIEKAKELGCETFDFEGSSIKGVEKFFRSFGGNINTYFTVNKANVILEILLKFKKRNTF